MSIIDVRETECVTEIHFADFYSLDNKDLHKTEFSIYNDDTSCYYNMKIKDIDNLIEALKIAKKEWSE